MKITSFFLLCCLNLVLLIICASQVHAKVPRTEKIAFSSNRKGNWEIYIMNPDGSRLRQIGKPALGAYSPAWSPQGDKIVYTEEVVERDRQIVVVDLGTGRKKQLTRRGLNITPAWFNPKTLSVTPHPHLLTTTWGKIKK